MLNVRFYGKKPYKAAIIHGGPGAPGSVAAIARKLSANIGVIEPIQTKTTIMDLLDELNEIVKMYCIEPVTFVGHSWGAWLVCLYAAKYPKLTKKVILVGSGPFEMQYAEQIDETRLRHLTQAEGKEYNFLLKSGNTKSKDNYLRRLGELVDKTDNYCAIVIYTDNEDCLPIETHLYSSIWAEADAMRKNGKLLEQVSNISCPVVAIHGDYDPHPAEGVRLPLTERLTDFSFYLLEKCGHSPWKEKYATERFYEILRAEIADESR